MNGMNCTGSLIELFARKYSIGCNLMIPKYRINKTFPFYRISTFKGEFFLYSSYFVYYSILLFFFFYNLLFHVELYRNRGSLNREIFYRDRNINLNFVLFATYLCFGRGCYFLHVEELLAKITYEIH